MKAQGIVGWEDGYLNYIRKMSLETGAEWKHMALWDGGVGTWTTLIN
jgi:hypothetical protein